MRTAEGVFYAAEADGLFFLAGQEWRWECPEWQRFVRGEGSPPPGLPYIDPEKARLLAPTLPSKVVAVGLNYRGHAREIGVSVPEEPILFLKPATSVIGPGEAILLPAVSRRVDYEAELAVVMGRRARKVSPERVFEYVLGYTCANDVTARDLQEKDGQWTRSKSFDTFCPLGPWVETDLDPAGVQVICRVNGAVKQQGCTRDLVFSVADLVAFASGVMTLQPGDVILTGTPSGIGPLAPGDVVEVEVEGIGKLRNPVQANS